MRASSTASRTIWCDVESNICHGARVFGRYLKRTGNVQRALLRYNGCVVSANTPNCHRYPAKVIRAARQVRRDSRIRVSGDAMTEGGRACYRP